jgi:plastocyanin
VEPQTVFYVIGGALAVLAVTVSFFGLRERSFPGSRAALAGGVALFALFVVTTTTAAVISARDEQEHREEELAEEQAAEEAAGEEAAEAEETGAEGPSGATEDEADQAQGEAAPAAGGGTLGLSSPEDGSTVYDQTELMAAAGEVTIEYTNPSPVDHNVAIEGDGQTLDEGELVTGGDVSTATAELQPGEYAYYCTVPGHREAGMEGTLTVE